MDDELSDSEDVLVYVEFEDSVNIEKYRSIHVLGVDGEHPIIQMDDTFFTGKYSNALGTYMLFEDDQHPQPVDPLFDKLPERNLKYFSKTRKLLKMEHAYVSPKEVQDQQIKNEINNPDDNLKPVHFSTVQEGLDALKTELNLNASTISKKECTPEPMDTSQT